MRKVMMTMMVLLMAVTVATAQRGQGHKADNYLSELDLSTEQQAQVKAIREESSSQMRQLREKNQDQRPDRAAMKKMREDAGAKIQAVLTPEQRKKLETLKAERKAAWKAVDKEAMKADLKAHTETKVKPVIAAARARFDQVISAEDQVAIERLRPVFASKPGRKETRTAKDGKKGQKPGDEERSERKAKMEQWKTDHASEIAKLKALTTKYATDLKSLQTRMVPQQKQWAKEKREIAARYLPEGVSSAEGQRGKARLHKGKSKDGNADNSKTQRKGDKEGKENDWPRAAAFLLLKG